MSGGQVPPGIARITPVDETGAVQGDSVEVPLASARPPTMREIAGHIKGNLMGHPSGDLRRFCEIAVQSETPPHSLEFLNGEYTHSITAEQARHAVAAVLAVLTAHHMLPNEVMTW